MASYTVTIDGVTMAPQVDWSLNETVNGPAVLQIAIESDDGSVRPALDQVVHVAEGVLIASVSVANPTIITTAEPHGIVDGQTVEIYANTGANPTINGLRIATRLSTTTFSVPVNVTSKTPPDHSPDGRVERRIFGGVITRTTETGAGGFGIAPIVTSVEATDNSVYAEWAYVEGTLASGTLKSQLTTLVAAMPDITLDAAQVDGPTVPERICAFGGELVRDVLNALTTASGGYLWRIDPYQVLKMEPPGTETAPATLVVDRITR